MVANSDMFKTLKMKSPANKNTVLNAIPINEVIAYAQAKSEDGGSGAVIVLLGA